MRLPRHLSGRGLAKALRRLGYQTTRQTGSHIRLTTQQHGEHHVTIPDHKPLRIGTLAAILADVAQHQALTRDELIRLLFSNG
jgi:predicted RNA binding protein YcfA (HicA-like mRNA interferase family)